MAHRDRRARATGRLGTKRGERYALIPEEVMQSQAYRAQPDWSKPVVFALACRYHGNNNGDLSLTLSEARKLGVAHQWKLYAGLKLLREAGLIEMTRQGLVYQGKKLCSLYAVSWRGIDKPPDGVSYDAGIVWSPLPDNGWARWEMPAKWRQLVKDVARANHGQKKKPLSPTVGANRSPTVGATNLDIAQLRGVTETPSVAPTVVDTSKTLGRGPKDKPTKPSVHRAHRTIQ
jgi:hypothetical protein